MTQDIKNQLGKIDSYENLNYKGMQERLLLKCENTICADEIVNLLNIHNIASRQHDESQDPRVGAYGALTGIAIYVFEKDYERAIDLVNPVFKEMNNVNPFCPKCGSEDVMPIIRRHDYGTIITLFCLFLILIPGIYIALPEELGLRSSAINSIALVMVVVGFILMFVIKYANTNYKCERCGKKFNHH